MPDAFVRGLQLQKLCAQFFGIIGVIFFFSWLGRLKMDIFQSSKLLPAKIGETPKQN